jgi:hypothetical protein
VKKSARKRQSKICSVCGVRKPLHDFVLNPAALIKEYSEICSTCRNKQVKTGVTQDDDEGSGGKGRGLAVDFLTKWMHLRDQEQQKEKTLEFKKELNEKFDSEKAALKKKKEKSGKEKKAPEKTTKEKKEAQSTPKESEDIIKEKEARGEMPQTAARPLSSATMLGFRYLNALNRFFGGYCSPTILARFVARYLSLAAALQASTSKTAAAAPITSLFPSAKSPSALPNLAPLLALPIVMKNLGDIKTWATPDQYRASASFANTMAGIQTPRIFTRLQPPPGTVNYATMRVPHPDIPKAEDAPQNSSTPSAPVPPDPSSFSRGGSS